MQNMLPSMVLWQLTRHEELEEEFDARVARLTAKQRAVIVRVLEALTRSEPAPEVTGTWRGHRGASP